jgi:hypothetical protein
MQKTKLFHLTPTAVCTFLLASTNVTWAADDPIPYYVGVSQTVTADTNIFRLDKAGPVKRDLISSTALEAGLDQPLGRGRFVADIRLNTNRYKNNDQLNYSGGEGNLRLDWESINRVSGDIVLYRRQSLYNPPNGSISNERDVVSDMGTNIRARLGLVTVWSLDGGVAYNQTRHSNSQQTAQELNQTSGNVGVSFRPNDLWSVRLGLRETSAKYPQAILVANNNYLSDNIKRHDIDLSGNWNPSGASKLDARVSVTRENHSQQGYRNGNLLTGLVGHNWLITGKTSLRTELARDTSVGAGDRNLGLLGQPNGNATVRNSISFNGKWEATAKVSVDGGYSYGRRKLENVALTNNNTGVLSKTVSAQDTTNTLSIGATYRPNNTVQLGCKLTNEKRGVSGDTNAGTSRYSVDTGMCQLQLRI